MKSTTIARFDVYMLLHDPVRLARLIKIQGLSKRAVARAAGWKSHTYLLRLLDPNDPANTCGVEPAVKMTALLKADLYDFFLPKVITDNDQNDTRRVA